MCCTAVNMPVGVKFLFHMRASILLWVPWEVARGGLPDQIPVTLALVSLVPGWDKHLVSKLATL